MFPMDSTPEVGIDVPTHMPYGSVHPHDMALGAEHDAMLADSHGWAEADHWSDADLGDEVALGMAAHDAAEVGGPSVAQHVGAPGGSSNWSGHARHRLVGGSSGFRLGVGLLVGAVVIVVAALVALMASAGPGPVSVDRPVEPAVRITPPQPSTTAAAPTTSAPANDAAPTGVAGDPPPDPGFEALTPVPPPVPAPLPAPAPPVVGPSEWFTTEAQRMQDWFEGNRQQMVDSFNETRERMTEQFNEQRERMLAQRDQLLDRRSDLWGGDG